MTKARLLRIIRLQQARLTASLSTCILPNRKFGALLLHPSTCEIIAEGRNGTAVNSLYNSCGPNGTCLRQIMNVPSGTRAEIGCIHAEQNLLMHCAQRGVSTANTWIVVTGEPCLGCAKLIQAAGITRVIYLTGGYSGNQEGLNYLNELGVELMGVSAQELAND